MASCDNCGKHLGGWSVSLRKLVSSQVWCEQCIEDATISDRLCPFCGEMMLHGVGAIGGGRAYLHWKAGKAPQMAKSSKVLVEQFFLAEKRQAFHCVSCGALATQLHE